MTVLLPSKRSEPTMEFSNIKALFYGPKKIGKSTVVNDFDVDVLFLACEPGLNGLATYDIAITSWKQFRETCAAIAEAPTDMFPIIAVDTVDQLYKMCTDYVCEKLGIDHPSDAEWGKGWAAVRDEFQLRVAKLSNLGRGVWFISHSQEREIKTRVGSITKTMPALQSAGLDFLHGFCDAILLAHSELTKDGERRVIRTKATENYDAGCRIPLTDPIPMNAKALIADINRAAKESK